MPNLGIKTIQRWLDLHKSEDEIVGLTGHNYECPLAHCLEWQGAYNPQVHADTYLFGSYGNKTYRNLPKHAADIRQMVDRLFPIVDGYRTFYRHHQPVTVAHMRSILESIKGL